MEKRRYGIFQFNLLEELLTFKYWIQFNVYVLQDNILLAPSLHAPCTFQNEKKNKNYKNNIGLESEWMVDGWMLNDLDACTDIQLKLRMVH